MWGKKTVPCCNACGSKDIGQAEVEVKIITSLGNLERDRLVKEWEKNYVVSEAIQAAQEVCKGLQSDHITLTKALCEEWMGRAYKKFSARTMNYQIMSEVEVWRIYQAAFVKIWKGNER